MVPDDGSIGATFRKVCKDTGDSFESVFNKVHIKPVKDSTWGNKDKLWLKMY